MKSLGLCIPVYNGQSDLEKTLPALREVIPRLTRVLGIDSSSTDNSAQLLKDANFEVITIASDDFDHGGTRQMAVDLMPECELIIFLTQDAELVSDDSIHHLIQAFEDPDIAVAYGRQLPRRDAGPIEAHARLFSYPSTSIIKSKALIPDIGLRAAVVSNSFAAYRRSHLLELGGFPKGTLFAEDTLVGSKAILAGLKVAYIGNAEVYHSHRYSLLQEYRRYFDNGAFYSREKWIIDAFGKAEGSGKAFVVSELKYLLRHAPWLLPESFIRTVVKFVGYKTGSIEKHLPAKWKAHLSMNRRFWKIRSPTAIPRQ